MNPFIYLRKIARGKLSKKDIMTAETYVVELLMYLQHVQSVFNKQTCTFTNLYYHIR